MKTDTKTNFIQPVIKNKSPKMQERFVAFIRLGQQGMQRKNNSGLLSFQTVEKCGLSFAKVRYTLASYYFINSINFRCRESKENQIKQWCFWRSGAHGRQNCICRNFIIFIKFRGRLRIHFQNEKQLLSRFLGYLVKQIGNFQ